MITEHELFNSHHEISYRILLLLSVCIGEALSIDRITALDFMAIYGQDFNISGRNLHGTNPFRFSEYAGRRQTISDSIKSLVVFGYVQFHPHNNGFLYRISPEGISFCQQLFDDYANSYRSNALWAIRFSKDYSDRELAKIISDYSIARFREE